MAADWSSTIIPCLAKTSCRYLIASATASIVGMRLSASRESTLELLRGGVASVDKELRYETLIESNDLILSVSDGEVLVGCEEAIVAEEGSRYAVGLVKIGLDTVPYVLYGRSYLRYGLYILISERDESAGFV